jgi:hypothetical protein
VAYPCKPPSAVFSFLFDTTLPPQNKTIFDLTIFSFLFAIFFFTSPIYPERNAPQMRNLPSPSAALSLSL